LRQEKEAMFNEFQQERNEMMEQINSLQEENSKYLDTIVRHSKENAEQNLSRFGTFPSQEYSFLNKQKLMYIRTNGSKAYELPVQNASKIYLLYCVLKIIDYDSFAGSNQQPLKVHNNVMNPANVYIGPTSVRALTLKQMKDVIEEIYNSKAKYDQRCLEAKLPRETMEQHMYTYLNQKYGLKVMNNLLAL